MAWYTVLSSGQLHKHTSSGQVDCSKNCNQIIKYYNEKDWKGVIKEKEEADKSLKGKGYGITYLHPVVYYLEKIARFNINDDYISAFVFAQWGKPYTGTNENEKEFYPVFIKEGKKIWEIKHGRKMTDEDFLKLHVETCEKSIVRNINENDIEWIWKYVDEWEELTNRKMSKEEQIRIAGKPFPKRGKSSSSPTTSSGKKGKGGVVVIVMIIIIAALYFGRGFLLTKLDGLKNLIPAKTEQTTEE